MKNRILKVMAYTNGLLLVLSMCTESENLWYVPPIVMAVTGTWLMLFAYATGSIDDGGNTTRDD